MVRVFLSRFTPGLRPGEGDKIDWQTGERTLIISGPDQGRIFVIDSDSMTHPAVPQGTYVREGWFEDDPGKRFAKAESALWFPGDPAGSKSSTVFRS